jgi:hypothetical protein
MDRLARQKWLAMFLELVDRGAPAMEFRRRLGIGFAVLPNHVRSIESYRIELLELNELAKRQALGGV